VILHAVTTTGKRYAMTAAPDEDDGMKRCAASTG
jgi:hypothetical protein